MTIWPSARNTTPASLLKCRKLSPACFNTTAGCLTVSRIAGVGTPLTVIRLIAWKGSFAPRTPVILRPGFATTVPSLSYVRPRIPAVVVTVREYRRAFIAVTAARTPEAIFFHGRKLIARVRAASPESVRNSPEEDRYLT